MAAVAVIRHDALFTGQAAASRIGVSFADFIDWRNTPQTAPKHVHIDDLILYRGADLHGWLVGQSACFDACRGARTDW